MKQTFKTNPPGKGLKFSKNISNAKNYEPVDPQLKIVLKSQLK